MALQFKSLLTRTLTAAVFVGVLLSCIWYNYFSFTLLFFVVSVWGLLEFYKICEKLGARPFKIFGTVGAVVLYLLGALYAAAPFAFLPLHFLVVILFLVFAVALFSSHEKPVQDAAYTIAGIVYTVLPFVLLNRVGCIEWKIGSAGFLDRWNYNPHYILGPLLLIWANDTFAYLVGSLIGKHKLYERISPGKTWEGSIGGAILTMASVYLIAQWYPELSYANWLVIAAIMIVFGTLGDLIESMLKRQAEIKDSGSIMPGHGGILDRFDSLLFASPFVYFYLDLVI
jgi:phosphatidate cytidylyltransferase